jgi:hypothetical protein
MSPVTRFMLSNGNLAGFIAAALVTVLYLVGVLGSLWFPMALVGYAAGVVAFYRPQPKSLPQGLETKDYLEWLRVVALPKLPQEAASRLQHILDLATEIWPRLKEMEAQGLVQVENRTMLKQTLTKLLPDLVQNYLKLPAVYAKTHKVEGKTPLMLFSEQLSLLEAHVVEIRDGVYAEEVDGLLASGRFLQEKFDKSMRIG